MACLYIELAVTVPSCQIMELHKFHQYLIPLQKPIQCGSSQILGFSIWIWHSDLILACAPYSNVHHASFCLCSYRFGKSVSFNLCLKLAVHEVWSEELEILL